MYELKLLNNWELKAQEKVYRQVNNKRKLASNLTKQQIKEITKIMAQAKVVESTDNYTVYQLN